MLYIINLKNLNYLSIIYDITFNLKYIITDILQNNIYIILNNIHIMFIKYIIILKNKKNYKIINTFKNILYSILLNLFNNIEYSIFLNGINYKLIYKNNLLIFDIGYSHFIIIKNKYYNLNYNIIQNTLKIKSINFYTYFLVSYIIKQYLKLKVLNKYKKKGFSNLKNLIIK